MGIFTLPASITCPWGLLSAPGNPILNLLLSDGTASTRDRANTLAYNLLPWGPGRMAQQPQPIPSPGPAGAASPNPGLSCPCFSFTYLAFAWDGPGSPLSEGLLLYCSYPRVFLVLLRRADFMLQASPGLPSCIRPPGPVLSAQLPLSTCYSCCGRADRLVICSLSLSL